jgi:hypothetical protein
LDSEEVYEIIGQTENSLLVRNQNKIRLYLPKKAEGKAHRGSTPSRLENIVRPKPPTRFTSRSSPTTDRIASFLVP